MALARNLFIGLSLFAACSILFLTFEMYREETMTYFTRNCTKKYQPTEESRVPVKLNLPSQDASLLANLNKHEKLLEQATDPLQSSASCIKPVFLAIFIASSPNGFRRRNAIRGTWGTQLSKKNNLIKTVFLIGKTNNKKLMNLIKTESEIFQDIVFGEFHEDYRNLTYKTRLGLKWANFHCQADYILKTDDDVFINPIPLVNWLKKQPKNRFYSGWCNFDSPVVRDPNNKWYISKDDYAGETYPGYCLGGGYVMSKDVLQRIMAISYGRKLFPMEDLYVGFMVKDLKDVTPKDNKQGFNLVFNGIQGCGYNSLYLAHPVDPDNQLKMMLEAQFAQRTC